MTEPEESMDLFADVITGVLGIVMFTALFFALRALSANRGVSGVEGRPEMRAALLL